MPNLVSPNEKIGVKSWNPFSINFNRNGDLDWNLEAIGRGFFNSLYNLCTNNFFQITIKISVLAVHLKSDLFVQIKAFWALLKVTVRRGGERQIHIITFENYLKATDSWIKERL